MTDDEKIECASNALHKAVPNVYDSSLGFAKMLKTDYANIWSVYFPERHGGDGYLVTRLKEGYDVSHLQATIRPHEVGDSDV